MKRLMTMGVCMLAALALGVVGVATASGGPPIRQVHQKSEIRRVGLLERQLHDSCWKQRQIRMGSRPGAQQQVHGDRALCVQRKIQKCVSGLA